MNYELSFLIPNLKMEERNNLFKEIEEKIKEIGGEIETEFIEKRSFAYPIRKHLEGFLGIINFSLEKNKLKEFSDFLKNNVFVLRKLIERKEEKRVLETISRIAPTIKKPIPKEKKVKLEELDERLEELLK